MSTREFLCGQIPEEREYVFVEIAARFRSSVLVRPAQVQSFPLLEQLLDCEPSLGGPASAFLRFAFFVGSRLPGGLSRVNPAASVSSGLVSHGSDLGQALIRPSAKTHI
jgi:hypothetical protein